MAPRLKLTALPPLLVAVAGLLVTLALGSLSFAWEQQRWLGGARSMAAERVHSLERNLEHELRAVRHLGALFGSSGDVSAAEFRRFAEQAEFAPPASNGIAWFEHVPAAERRAFERSHGVTVTELHDGRVIPAPSRQHYFPVRYGILPEHQFSMTGFSPTAPGARRDALLQALRERRTTMTAPLPLVAVPGTPLGLVIYHPVYAPDAATEPLGVVGAAHRIEALFARPGIAAAGAPQLQVVDITGQRPVPLYDETRSAADDAASTVIEEQIEVGGRQWLVRLLAPAMPFPLPTLLAVLSSLLLSVVLTAYVYAQVRQRQAVEQQVRARTRDLSASNRALERTLQAKEQAIADLADSESRYRLLADNASDIITRASPDGGLLYVSPASQRMLGFSPEEMEGRSIYDFYHPDDIYRIRQAHERALAEPGIYSANYRLRHAEGHYVWVDTTHRFLTDAEGRATGIISVIRNISEQKAAERALRESEALFRSAFEDAAEGMALFDPQRRFVRINQAFCQMTGYSRDEMRQLRVDDVTHPADLGVTPSEMERLLSGAAQRVRLEKRYLGKHGRTVWLAAQLSLVRDHRGQPLYFISQSQDITERKETEAALEALRRRQELILNTTTEGIYGLDAEGRASFVNRAATELLGYSQDELLGQNLHDLVHAYRPDGTPYPREECPIQACLHDRTTRHIERDAFWHRDGQPLPVRYTCSPMAEGERVQGVVVVFSVRAPATPAQEEHAPALVGGA